jgi:DNA polymerase-4
MRIEQPRPVRLIGVSLGSLTDRDAPTQLSLFDLAENESSQKEVDKVVDGLRDTMGENAVYRATSHDWINRKGS